MNPEAKKIQESIPAGELTWANLHRPLSRTLAFGGVSGALWSVVPWVLNDPFYSALESATMVAAGALAGMIVSLMLMEPLRRCGGGFAWFLGFVALPLGAFVFGVLISVVQLAAKHFCGVAYRYVQYGFEPVRTGVEYAFWSSVSLFGLVLFPLSIATTFMLRSRIRPKPRMF